MDTVEKYLRHFAAICPYCPSHVVSEVSYEIANSLVNVIVAVYSVPKTDVDEELICYCREDR